MQFIEVLGGGAWKKKEAFHELFKWEKPEATVLRGTCKQVQGVGTEKAWILWVVSMSTWGIFHPQNPYS